MSKRPLVALAVVLVLAACGGGGDDEAAEDPAGSPTTTLSKEERHRGATDALRRQFDYVDKGQWGPHWEELHPGQQAFIPKALFMRCFARDASVDVEDAKVLSTYDERVPIPGTTETADSVAISAEVTIRQGAFPKQTERETFHEFLLPSGQWRWSLIDTSAEAFKAGKCPED